MGISSCLLNIYCGFCPHTRVPAHTQHTDKCAPTITTAQRDDGHGFCGGLDVKWPLGLMSTLALQLVCAVPDCGILEKQSPLKEEGHWRFYGQVQLHVHSLMPYLPQAASGMLSCLPCHERLNTSYTGVQTNPSPKWLLGYLITAIRNSYSFPPIWSIQPFIYSTNTRTNIMAHTVFYGNKGTSMDQTKKKNPDSTYDLNLHPSCVRCWICLCNSLSLNFLTHTVGIWKITLLKNKVR